MENFFCISFNSFNIFRCLKQAELFQSHRLWAQVQFIKLRMVSTTFWGIGSKKIDGQETWFHIAALLLFDTDVTFLRKLIKMTSKIYSREVINQKDRSL